MPKPRDIIYLTDLRIDTVIGVYAWERQFKQTLIFDIQLAADVAAAAATDALEDTVDYNAITQRLKAFADENHFDLVETLAERMTEIILNEFHVPWVHLKVNKKAAIRGVREVGVIVERQRDTSTDD